MSLDAKASASMKPTVPRDRSDLTRYSLEHSLSLVDEFFGIDRLIAEAGAEFVNAYYRQSLVGYMTIYNPWQCMHVALQEGGRSEEDAFFAQAAEVARQLGHEPGQRVLELGCGLGANSLHLAARFPEVEFLGTDLMEQHVSRANGRARALPNLSFREASFDDLPDDLGQFDVIFAVETLCYARDPGQVAARIARHLRPGGRVILFDAHRKAGFDAFPPPLVTAARLYEITTAVTRGFHHEGRWQQALDTAGLVEIQAQDVTTQTLDGLAKIHSRATKAFTDRKWRVALRMMPHYFARNTVAGLLGYHACFGADEAPRPDQGPIVYQKLIARKPAA